MALLTSRLDDYRVESGLLVNHAKSKALPLGSWGRGEGMSFPYEDRVTILGMNFCSSIRSMATENWMSRMGLFREVLVDALLRVLDIP